MFRSSPLFLSSITKKSSPVTTTTTKKHLPSHRDTHKPSMSRRFSLPRGGALEESRVLTRSSKQISSMEPLPFADRQYASTDCQAGFTGTLDYWRHAIMRPSHKDHAFANYRHFGTVPPQWDIVVPLLARIREAGRSTFWKENENARSNIGGTMSTPAPSVFFEQQHQQRHSSNSQSKVAFSGSSSVLMRNGDKTTPEAVQKQMLVELYVRLPLLEQTLDSTATPSLVAKLFQTLNYCNVTVPETESFATGSEAQQGLLNSKLRLRALLIAALRKTELDLIKEKEQKQNTKQHESELRKKRRIVLTARDTSGLFDFLTENKNVFTDCSQEQLDSILGEASKQGGQCELSVLNIDIEKEIPNVLNWAKEGKEFVLAAERRSKQEEGREQQTSDSAIDGEGSAAMARLSGSATSLRKPVQWLVEGTIQEEQEEEYVKIEATKERKSDEKRMMV